MTREPSSHRQCCSHVQYDASLSTECNEEQKNGSRTAANGRHECWSSEWTRIDANQQSNESCKPRKSNQSSLSYAFRMFSNKIEAPPDVNFMNKEGYQGPPLNAPSVPPFPPGSSYSPFHSYTPSVQSSSSQPKNNMYYPNYPPPFPTNYNANQMSNSFSQQNTPYDLMNECCKDQHNQ